MSDLARRERIAVAVLDLLTSACAPIKVERNRRSQVDSSEAPFLVLFDLGHQADLINAGDVTYTMQLEIEGTIAGSAASLGPSMNALYVQVLLALQAEPSLGGLCTTLRETAFDVRVVPEEESAKSYAQFSLSMEATFETPDGDPTG